MSKPSNPFIVFPTDLLQLDGDLAYPQIEFTVQEDSASGGGFTSIYLPMPASINFSDGGDYSTIELGAIGAGGGMDALAKALGGDFQGATKSLIGAGEQQLSSVGTRAKAILASILPGVDKETAMFAMKKIRPPNQNTTFKGNKLRSFSFSFKLIANSTRDTEAIHNIHRTFRRYTYAGASNDAPNVLLDYPPLWKIRFLQGDRENEYMPKIFACYLESFQCTFNGEANIFRYDGSPFDITCQLNFQETRVLTRNDIDQLEAGTSDRGIDPNTGLATVTSPTGINVPIASPSKSVAPTQGKNVNLPN